MSTHRFMRWDGAFTPREVEAMARALERLALPTHTDKQREEIAAQIIRWYQTGVTDEEELAQMLIMNLTADAKLLRRH